MAVYQAVEKWGCITVKIMPLFSDTTCNTGRANDAYINLEKLFNCDLFEFSLSTSYFYLVLRSYFDSLMGTTSGPDMSFIRRFGKIWAKLNRKVYISGSNEVPDDLCSTIFWIS